MPLRKFHDVAEMKRAGTWREAGDPALFAAMRALWDFGARTSRRALTPGVTKFASIEEMDRHQRAQAHAPP